MLIKGNIMTVTQKYLEMNRAYNQMYTALFELDADETPEPEEIEQNVNLALNIISSYLDWYKANNDVHTRTTK